MSPLETDPPLARRVLAEFVGTAFLLAAIVGSGAMAESLTDDVALQLISNSFATCAALTALILTFEAVSGAHFNPAVTLAELALKQTDARTALAYIPTQVAGAALGVVVANLMFDLDAVNISEKSRDGANLALAEGVATLGLLLVIYGVSRAHDGRVTAFAVGGYIAGAFTFTASTSFANPAVTLARTLSNTFAGIDPASAPGYLAAQLAAIPIAVILIKTLFPTTTTDRN